MIANKTLDTVNKATLENADLDFRSHLGASTLGTSCARSLWYNFRWASKENPKPETVRLWARGHREEEVFEKLLKDAGISVETVDHQTGKQHVISDFGGHYGGSFDGIAWNVPDLPSVLVLLEMKTHKASSFKDLVKKGVESSKYQHFVQMQLYMGGGNLKAALYCAVNKDTDELYFEIVEFSKSTYEKYKRVAYNVIHSETPLTKVSENKSWYQCKWCPHSSVCHDKKEPIKNCRTCKFSEIDTENGGWSCLSVWTKRPLSKEQQAEGCERYELNQNFLK